MVFESKKGQVAVEYLMIAGFLLVVIGIAFFYSFSTLNQSTSDSKAVNAVNKIAAAVDQVYAMGPGSKITLTIDLPDNIDSQLVLNNSVGYKANVNGNLVDYYADTKAKLYGALPISGGVNSITLQVSESGQVFIGESTIGLGLTPSVVVANIDINETLVDQNYLITLQNLNPTAVSSVISSVDGTIAPYVTIGTVPSTLTANQSVDFNITLNFPGSITAQTYSGYLTVDSNNGSARTLVQIVVNTAIIPPEECTTGSGVDTNWQTSWPVFDANMKSQYQLVNENTLHWHDTRYYTKTQSDVNWAKYILIGADINFSQLKNFPTACPTGQAIQDINGTNFTCVPVGGSSIDTNWQTSWSLLDANLKATYPLRSDVNSWGDDRYAPLATTSVIKVKTADQTTQNTNTSVTDLDLSLEANKRYGFHCYLTASSNNTAVGIQTAMLTPSTPTYFSAKIVGWTSTTALAYTIVTASDTYQANTASQGTPNYVYEISGAINNVNAGTLVPRFKSETASNVIIRAGSWCEYTFAG